MNILVTGANGQLGTHIRLRAAESVHRYLFTDVDELDITRRDAVLNYVFSNDINLVINCAAYTDVEKSESDESVAELVNCAAVFNLADAMKVSGGTMIHVSTDYVFGGGVYNSPIAEDSIYNPTGVYGRSKMHGEQTLQKAGCHYLIFRTGWLYSEYGKNFMKTMLRILAPGKSIKVVFDQVGTPTYAGDLADVIFNVVEKECFRGKDGIYNFSNEGVCSWYDFAIEIARQASLTGCEILPCHSGEFPSKVERPPFSVLDKTKVKNTFGISIAHWTDGLSRCLANYQKIKSE